MKRQWLVIGLLLVWGLLLVACGGGGDSKAPVDMEKEETSGFTIERPKAWNTNSMDFFGLNVLIVSNADISADSLLGGGDFGDAFTDTPGVIIMSVPQEMADQGGDIGFSVDGIKDIAAEEEDVEIIREGDITVDGIKGYEFVGKGAIAELGSGKMGAHLAVFERDAGPLAFIGFSPEKDIDKNLEIFEYMLKSLDFK